MAYRRAPRRDVRWWFWAEAALAVAAAALFVVTEIWPDWIEAAFGVDPDHGDGALEWIILVALVLVASTTFALARHELRRADDAELTVRDP
jgi:heme/copper-type cytochrome/quinol oxidase subunit 3